MRTLAQFKSLLEPEIYLHCVKILKFRVALSRLRCSAHGLEIEIGRRNAIDVQLRWCKLCARVNEFVVEDEYHFVLVCSAFTELRTSYLPQHIVEQPTTSNFVELFKSSNVKVIQNLANYVYKGLKLRDMMLSTL